MKTTKWMCKCYVSFRFSLRYRGNKVVDKNIGKNRKNVGKEKYIWSMLLGKNIKILQSNIVFQVEFF